jgi:hypothetical protein
MVLARTKNLEMGCWPKEMPPNGYLPGQNDLHQGNAPAHGAPPGETPRNGILPGRNVSEWVIAREKCQDAVCLRNHPARGQVHGESSSARNQWDHLAPHER